MKAYSKKIVLVIVLLLASCFAVFTLFREPLQHTAFSYLSLTRPIAADVLIIEGWLTNRMLKESVAEYNRGNYRYCVVSGRTHFSPTPRNTLIQLGIDSSRVKSIEAKTRQPHRTYQIALAARNWLKTNDPDAKTINVFTAGPHGRKSWTLFKRVFGRAYTVGVVSSSIEPDDTALWWKSNRGLWNIMEYGIGYLYAMVWPFEVI